MKQCFFFYFVGELVFRGSKERPVILRYAPQAAEGGKWFGIAYGNRPGRSKSVY